MIHNKHSIIQNFSTIFFIYKTYCLLPENIFRTEYSAYPLNTSHILNIHCFGKAGSSQKPKTTQSGSTGADLFTLATVTRPEGVAWNCTGEGLTGC